MTLDPAKPDTPLHGRIADALARLGSLARSKEQTESTSETLSPLQSRALVVLHRRGDLRVGQIAEELLVTYGTVSVALTALEQKGLVNKFQDPDEHRAVRLELTRPGRRIAQKAAGWGAEALQPAIRALRTEESATLLATLLKLILSLEREGVIGAARMCISCKYFVADGGRGKRPHFCNLLDVAIGEHDLRVDCPEHERAAESQLAVNARALKRAT